MISERLKKLRKEKRYSLCLLAELTSISRKTLWQIETGRKSPRISTLEKIAKVFEEDISVFFNQNVSLSEQKEVI